jgi:hypothetical protein
MVTRLEDPAPGVLAFAISGRVTRADYAEVLLPPIRALVEHGEPIRVLAVLEAFTGMEAGPLVAELKAIAKVGSGQKAVKASFAVVTDLEWVRRGIRVFGRFVPGEVRVFGRPERAAAEAWLKAAAR